MPLFNHDDVQEIKRRGGGLGMREGGLVED